MKKIKLVGIWITLVCLVAVLGLPASAQKSKTVFKDLTWEQAAEQARKEGKIVLVDAMRPAMKPEDQKKQEQAERDLFKVPGISEFCNQNVIAIHINMNSEAGQAFAPKLMMNMYPTYGFFMPNGDILGTASPYKLAQNPESFLEAGEKALKAAAVKRNNTRSITFGEMALKEAMEKAKKEKKLIFIDAYTDYCQPCMLMVKNVFSLNNVADFYNQNFINLKIHFGKEKELAEKYGTSGYPAFLFLNGDGKLVHLAGGYTEADKFIGYGKEALKKAEGIAFANGTWSQILEKARGENKLIFVDCYTSWCGPCKQMAATTFMDPEVATFFNETFVNVKVDMEKGEGKELKDKFDVTAFPTLVFANGAGEVVHRVVGGLDVKELMTQGKIAESGKGLAYAQAEYKNGNREPVFIESYLTMLDLANLNQDAQAVSLEYFNTLDRDKLKEKAYWDIFAKYVNDVNSDLFQYVYANRSVFYPLHGEKEVNRKMQNVWAIGANRFVEKKDDKMVLNKKGFGQYVKRMKKAGVGGWENIATSASMANAEKVGDWKTYIELGDVQLKSGKVSDLLLYNWGLRVSKNCKDKALRLKAATWFDNAAAEAAKKEAGGKAGMMSYKAHFERIAGELKQ